MTDPKEIALAFIRPYVLRGDSYESLKESWMGAWGADYRAGIGISAGFGDCRGTSADALVVSQIGGQECCHVFSLRALFDEIRSPVQQPKLF